MTQTTLVCPASPLRIEPHRIRLDFNQMHWRVCRDHEWMVRGPEAPNWSRLASCPTAELVKRNEVREVWRVLLRGRLFYAKIYFASGLLTRMKNRFRGAACLLEWRTGWYAIRHGVPSIVPVACGLATSSDDPVTGVLVTEALDSAVPVDAYWESLGADEWGRTPIHNVWRLTEALAEAIARAHQGGFEHFDMHVGNVLVQDDQHEHPHVTFVDLHTVRVNRPINEKAVVRNLAQLNQWFMRNASRSTRLRFLRRYLIWRNRLAGGESSGRLPEVDVRKIAPIMERAARRHSSRLWAKRDRRIMRNGKYFAHLKFAHGWRGHAFLQAKRPVPGSRASSLHFSTDEWEQWLANPSRWLASQSRGRVIKDSHSGRVIRASLPVESHPLEVIVKSRRQRTRLWRLIRAFGRSRDLRSWRAGYALLNRDVPTARPLAVLERRTLGLLRESMLICEAVEGAKDLDRFVLEDLAMRGPRTARRVKDRLIESVVRLFKRLESRGLTHRDCKASNILVRFSGDDDFPHAWLADVDGLRRRNAWTRPNPFRPLVRLGVSLEVSPMVTRTDRLRFLRRYLMGPGKSHRGWKPVWRQLARLSERKRRAKQRRDQWKLQHYGRTSSYPR